MYKSTLRKWERLERRDLLAAFNIPWPEIDHLSLSFAPDGTHAGTQQSALYQSLQQVMPVDQWQLATLRAFQTWAVESDINIALVDDNGDAFDSLGFKQGDVRFGDVRIGALPMEADVLAVANPYDPFIANTWVGDVFLNADNPAIQAADDPAEALFSIMLHEAGHVLGIGHSSDPESPMYPQFDRAILALIAEDRTALQNLYGSRSPDEADATARNDRPINATPVALTDRAGALMSTAFAGDITSIDDVDFYALDVPDSVSELEIQLKASGISLLAGQISIFDEQGELLATEVAIDPRHNDLTLTVETRHIAQKLFLRIESGSEDVFGVGAYKIEIVPRTSSASLPPPMQVEVNPARHAANTEQLLATTPGYVEHTYYEVHDYLDASQPSSVFRVHSVDLGKEFTNVMTVVVGSERVPSDRLQVDIMDAQGRAIQATQIPNSRGDIALQIAQVKSDTDYLIRVQGRDLGQTLVPFEIEVDFAQDGTHLETFVSDTLDALQPVVTQTLHVLESQAFHFVLAASDWSEPNESGLEMEMVDASGATIFRMSVPDGATRSGDVLLGRGNYDVRFSSPGRLAGSKETFRLSGMTLSSPIGPQLRDTSRVPVSSAHASPVNQLTFYWTGVTPLAAPVVVSPNEQVRLPTARSLSHDEQSNSVSHPSHAIKVNAGEPLAFRVAAFAKTKSAADVAEFPFSDFTLRSRDLRNPTTRGNQTDAPHSRANTVPSSLMRTSPSTPFERVESTSDLDSRDLESQSALLSANERTESTIMQKMDLKIADAITSSGPNEASMIGTWNCFIAATICVGIAAIAKYYRNCFGSPQKNALGETAIHSHEKRFAITIPEPPEIRWWGAVLTASARSETPIGTNR